MNIKIEVPYPIKSEVWILRKVKYKVEDRKVYIRKQEHFEEYRIEPIYEQRWNKEKRYVKRYEIEEDDIQIVLSSNEWLEYDEDDGDIYLSNTDEFYIFTNEGEVNEKLHELSK